MNTDIAGKDVSEVFFGLHVSAVLEKYKRLQIGVIENEKPKYVLPQKGAFSSVPYAEPLWLTKGYHSPYFKASHLALAKHMREFTDTYVTPEAKIHEETNKRPTVELIQKMGSAPHYINQMRLGPGKHLHGLTLPGGLKGEDFDYFHGLSLPKVFESVANAFVQNWSSIRNSLVSAHADVSLMHALLFLPFAHQLSLDADGLQGGMVIGLPPVYVLLWSPIGRLC